MLIPTQELLGIKEFLQIEGSDRCQKPGAGTSTRHDFTFIRSVNYDSVGVLLFVFLFITCVSMGGIQKSYFQGVVGHGD